MESKISLLLYYLHPILVGNSLTKFSSLSTKDITTRLNKEEALGKHLNNIYTYATFMIYYILMKIGIFDKVWYMTQVLSLDRYTSSTTTLASIFWDNFLHDCILLTSSRVYFKENMEILLVHLKNHYGVKNHLANLKTRKRDKHHFGILLEFL